MNSRMIQDTNTLNALLVGFSEEENSYLRSILGEAGFVTQSEVDSGRALEMARGKSYQALVVAYPDKAMGIEVFLERIRSQSSASRQGTVALIAVRALLGEISHWVGRGANFSLDIDEAEKKLSQELVRRIKAPRRHTLRTISKLRVQLGAGQKLTLCQTENVSTTGMLLRMAPIFPVGASLSFELSLPGDSVPVRGQGVVIRHTSQQKEKISGLAVLFTSFLGKDGTRMASLLDAFARQAAR